MAGTVDAKPKVSKKTVVLRFSFVGFFVALGWILLIAIPFFHWPNALQRVAQISCPAMLIPSFGPSGGWTTVLMFLLLPLSNAAIYGLAALIISALLDSLAKVRGRGNGLHGGPPA